MDTNVLGLCLFHLGENTIFIIFYMSYSIRKNKKSSDTGNNIGMFIADSVDMASHGNNEPHVWDRHHSSIRSFFSSIFSRHIPNNTTPYKFNMYEIPIFAKVTIAFLAGWETFIVQNVFVQWVVTIYVFIGGGIWLCSQYISLQKKNLILSNTSKKETKRWTRIATAIRLQHNIDAIIIRCFIIAAIGVILFLINSN